VKKISSEKSTGVPESNFLGRRDRSIFLPQQKTWSDHRAWLTSCILHTVLFVALGILWRPQTRGTAGEADRPVGIAVVHETNQGNEYFLAGGSSAGRSASTTKPKPTTLSVSDAGGPPISVETLLSQFVGTSNSSTTNGSNLDGSLGSGLSGDGNTAGNGTGAGRGSGNKVKTSFFGTEGTGASFVFVIDRSDSMNVNQASPLNSAKRELLNSIKSLNEYHQFQIVFYNDSLRPMSTFGSSGRMIFATDNEKNRAERYVKGMPGDGATNHMPALLLGLSYGPDVLYFLTDAEDPFLSPTQLRQLQQRAELSRTTVHSVQFSIGPATSNGGWIRELAETNRGTYKYVDVTTLTATQE
jgi:hypothetical protein